MSCFESRDDVGQCYLSIGQQNNGVIQQVGRLIDYFVSTAGHGGQGQLNAFLADLLGDAPRAIRDELRRVTAG